MRAIARDRFGGLCVAVLLLLTARAAGAVTDFSGRWALTLPIGATGIPVSALIEITQTGTDVSFDAFLSTFTGTVTGDTFSVSTPPNNFPFPYGASIRGSFFLDRTDIVVGSALTFFANAPGVIDMQRCNCSDGNSVVGDGCDECFVERCYTCTGDPSVCTPAPDGAPCDDGRACTAGETCLAGVCGGGSPLTPCVDLTGRWHYETTTEVGSSSGDQVLSQHNTFLRLPGCAGLIDPPSGSFELGCAQVDFMTFESGCPLRTRSGQASADGSMYVDSVGFSIFLLSFGGCDTISGSTTATRLCGDGTVMAGDECDDGNVADGDGCDANCHIEPCWSCTGSPSTCTPLPDGTRCGDGDDCTSGDACQAGTCAGGQQLSCGACEGCGPLGCIAAPLSGCRHSTDPDRTSLEIHNPDSSPAGDRISWKWSKGEATSAAELADPLAGADYNLCVFDESGFSPALLFRAAAPAGPACDGDSCWDKDSDGELLYRNRAAVPNGLTRVRVTPGADGAARALVRGKGLLLSSGSPGLPAPPLPDSVRVQLQGEGGACLESIFSSTGVLINDARRGFKARADPQP